MLLNYLKISKIARKKKYTARLRYGASLFYAGAYRKQSRSWYERLQGVKQRSIEERADADFPSIMYLLNGNGVRIFAFCVPHTGMVWGHATHKRKNPQRIPPAGRGILWGFSNAAFMIAEEIHVSRSCCGKNIWTANPNTHVWICLFQQRCLSSAVYILHKLFECGLAFGSVLVDTSILQHTSKDLASLL